MYIHVLQISKINLGWVGRDKTEMKSKTCGEKFQQERECQFVTTMILVSPHSQTEQIPPFARPSAPLLTLKLNLLQTDLKYTLLKCYKHGLHRSPKDTSKRMSDQNKVKAALLVAAVEETKWTEAQAGVNLASIPFVSLKKSLEVHSGNPLLFSTTTAVHSVTRVRLLC